MQPITPKQRQKNLRARRKKLGFYQTPMFLTRARAAEFKIIEKADLKKAIEADDASI